MLTYSEFKRIFDALEGVHECEVYFKGTRTTYMITKNKGFVSFQRCSLYLCDGSDDFEYDSLDTLYHSVLVDGICFEKDWDKVETIAIDGAFDLACNEGIENLKEWYGLNI